jgi:hypothetical protein
MRKYPKAMISTSKLLNKTTCGPEGFTMCARLWDRRLEGCEVSKVLVLVVDWVFETLCNDKHHCRKSWVLNYMQAARR